jgi:hypothetical protein
VKKLLTEWCARCCSGHRPQAWPGAGAVNARVAVVSCKGARLQAVGMKGPRRKNGEGIVDLRRHNTDERWRSSDSRKRSEDVRARQRWRGSQAVGILSWRPVNTYTAAPMAPPLAWEVEIAATRGRGIPRHRTRFAYGQRRHGMGGESVQAAGKAYGA